MIRIDENHKHGFASVDKIEEMKQKLYDVVSRLMLSVKELTESNWQSELNKLHVNFPKIAGSVDSHTMNLLIHWLEYELMNFYNNKQQYIFNLDFNHLPVEYAKSKPFNSSELGNFSPILEFGNLHLHYTLIGRHFLEMFDANDVVSPSHQFRPQSVYNATCGLVFSEPSASDINLEMKRYYDKNGGRSFFRHEFDSIQMRKGFFKIGQLADVDVYNSKEKRDILRQQIQDAVVVSWEVIST